MGPAKPCSIGPAKYLSLAEVTCHPELCPVAGTHRPTPTTGASFPL